MFRLSILLLLLISLFTGAAAQETARVDSLEARGLRFVSSERVLVEFGVRKGDLLDSEAVARGIQRLYRTHRFETVDVGMEELAPNSILLVLNLQEWPRLESLEYEGFDKIDPKDLEDRIHLVEGGYLRPMLIAQAEREILAHCREEGYHAATLDIRREDADGEASLVLALDEGKKSKVREVRFEGNESFDRDRLLSQVRTKPKRLFSPRSWFNGSAFQPDSIGLDGDRLVRFYSQQGYLDARLKETRQEFNEEQDRVTVTYVIEEGDPYVIGTISWEGNGVLSDSTVAEFFPFEQGEPYQGQELDRAVFNLSSEYHNLGYLYSQVKMDRERRGDQVDLILRIYEGPLARVREVVVAGNEKTLDRVVRREVKIFPGELFSREKVERSYRDIFMLRFFDDIQFEPKADPSSGEVDLVYRVVERSSGQFGAGITYSEATSLAGFIQLGTPNFRGRGQNLNFNWEFGGTLNSFNVSFTEPWFMNRPYSVSGSVYNQHSSIYDEYYRDRKTGFTLGVGRPFPWIDFSRISLSYRLEQVELFDFTDAYYALGGSLADSDWPLTESSLSLTYYRNSTDNPFLPTRGSYFKVTAQASGGVLGGDLDFQKYLANYTWYQKLLGPLVLRFNQSMALVDGLDRPGQVPDNERFRMGGNRYYPLRGYSDFSIVPDGNSADLGGRIMTTGTVEVVIGINNSFRILAPFFDFGDTWNSLSQSDLTTLHRSVGIGARIEVPMMGVMGLDWAYPLDPPEGESGGRFHFKIGGDF